MSIFQALKTCNIMVMINLNFSFTLDNSG
jgi:hypothetical protein